MEKFSKKDLDKNVEPYYRACAMNFDDLNFILDYHKREPLGDQEPFFLATCNSDPSITAGLEKHGARRVNVVHFE